MKPLTPNQIEWIFAKCSKLCQKYINNPPSSVYEWRVVMDEVNKLYKSSKQGQVLMVPLLIQTVNYIDKISTEQTKIEDILVRKERT